jgi:hypothetical protein
MASAAERIKLSHSREAEQWNDTETSKESITRSTSQFVLVTLPAAPSTQTSVPSIRAT